MRKIITTALSAIMAICALMPISAFAATYDNSVGSVESDIAIIDDNTYTVVGVDSTQNKRTGYAKYEGTETQQTITTEVYATIAEQSIEVTYPTVLIMNGTKNAEGYWVADGKLEVKGDISGKTIINVVPQDADANKAGVNFTMSQNGKPDITATVEQQYTKFVVAGSSVTGTDVNKNVTVEYNANAVSQIKVMTNEASAGSWSGSYETLLYLSYAE